MSTHLWLLAYDISDDKVRTAVEKMLLRQGERVQLSVFECYMNPESLRRLLADAAPLLDPSSDSLRAYPVCLCCQERVFWQGRGQRPADPACYIV